MAQISWCVYTVALRYRLGKVCVRQVFISSLSYAGNFPDQCKPGQRRTTENGKRTPFPSDEPPLYGDFQTLFNQASCQRNSRQCQQRSPEGKASLNKFPHSHVRLTAGQVRLPLLVADSLKCKIWVSKRLICLSRDYLKKHWGRIYIVSPTHSSH